MTKNPENERDNYLLDRHLLASTRLTFQHFGSIQLQGWQLHPHVEASVQKLKNPRIADLATGNGVWAFALSDKYPNAEIIGTDITDQQYPNRTSIPPNIKLEIADLFEPFPERYHEYFDVVHIRLTAAFIYNREKDFLIRNILSLLKPGGWLQWEEIIAPPICAVHKDGSFSRYLPKPVQRIFNIANILPALEWANTLGNVYKEHGLVDVVVERPDPRPSIMLVQHEMTTWFFREIWDTMKKVGSPNFEEEREAAARETAEVYATGERWIYNWQVAIGRKPSAS